MSWREYVLRSRDYEKSEKEDWIKVREMAYASMIGSHLDPKKIPKTKEQFMPFDKPKRNKANASALERLRQLQLEYQKQKNGSGIKG